MDVKLKHKKKHNVLILNTKKTKINHKLILNIKRLLTFKLLE